MDWLTDLDEWELDKTYQEWRNSRSYRFWLAYYRTKYRLKRALLGVIGL